MKRNLLLMTLIVGTWVAANAQQDKEDVRIGLALMNKGKKELISQLIQLDSAHAVSFWKVYDQYENRYDNLVTERLGYIKQYVDGYDSLNDPKASELAEIILNNTRKIADLHLEYFPKFKKVIGGTKAATVYQLEIYVQTALQYKIQKQLPLIGQFANTETP